MIQSTPYGNIGYQGIDGAKTGKINSYESYPAVHKRVLKATGGKNGRMPWFFQFSKNGRRNSNDRTSKKKNYGKPNQSVVNRICARFDDIGKMNLSAASIPPFNWQMMLAENPGPVDLGAVQLFCDLDSLNLSNLIESKDSVDIGDKWETAKYDQLKDQIVYELNGLCGDYRAAYPSVVKYLFAGEGMNKASHKPMFWRVFGDIACDILEKNLQSCSVCPDCGMKTPEWAKKHMCPKVMKGFYVCVDCGKLCVRFNSRQYRCESCQSVYRAVTKKQTNVKLYHRKKGA